MDFLIVINLDESTFIFRDTRSDAICSFYFVFDENYLAKENNPRSDSTFRGVIFGAILFAYVQAHMG